MNPLKILFCLFITAAALSAEGRQPQKGETWNAISPSGLFLRATPDAKGAKVTKVTYGTPVQILEADTSHPFAAGGIAGYWVKAMAGKKEGWLFDGYLSRFPAPDKKCGNLGQYLDKKIGGRKGPKELPAPASANGTEFHQGWQLATEGGDSFRLYAPQTRPAELFLPMQICGEIPPGNFTAEGGVFSGEGPKGMENRISYYDDHAVFQREP